MKHIEPWSKRHKSVTADTPFSLSNSFAEPLKSEELIKSGCLSCIICFFVMFLGGFR